VRQARGLKSARVHGERVRRPWQPVPATWLLPGRGESSKIAETSVEVQPQQVAAGAAQLGAAPQPLLQHFVLGALQHFVLGALQHFSFGALQHFVLGALQHFCLGALQHFCFGALQQLDFLQQDEDEPHFEAAGAAQVGSAGAAQVGSAGAAQVGSAGAAQVGSAGAAQVGAGAQSPQQPEDFLNRFSIPASALEPPRTHTKAAAVNVIHFIVAYS